MSPDGSMKHLKYPLDSILITQTFGENSVCIPIKGGKCIGCDGLNPPKGYKSVYTGMTGHNGIDFIAWTGRPCYASLEGIVEEIVDEEARGKGIGIVSEKTYYCDEVGKKTQWKIRYWHLQSYVVKLGDKVKAGDLIGYCDNTGYSSGDHLHWEGKPVEYKKKKLINILQSNGYYGAVNLLPYTERLKYKFTRTMTYGMRNSGDVSELQIRLGLVPTGNYLEETRKAVEKYQRENKVASEWELNLVRGKIVGRKTLNKLNA